MRALIISCFLAGPLAADVVVLKSGARVSGRVVDKPTHYEVTTDAGLRTYLKDEVERVITNPKELLGDAEPLFEQAKAEFKAALDISNPAEQQAKVKEAIAKVTKSREAIASTREMFPEDKYSDLDTKLMQVMQLMRLLRDRLGSEIARRPASADPRKPDAPPPPPFVPAPAEDALTVLRDPAKRNDAGRRAMARSALADQRSNEAGLPELAAAATLFLSKTDAEWKLEGPALKALQDYFDKYLKEPAKLGPAAHQDAAGFLAGRVAGLKGAGAEALLLFAAGHLGHAALNAEVEKSARALGFVVQNGRVGTMEGHVVRDLNSWIANRDFDLAVLAWVKEYRSTDTPAVRFVWSWALLQLVTEKKRGFHRPAEAIEGIRAPEAIFRDHLAALSKSIRTVAPCGTCAGEARLRCTNCHGKKDINYPCGRCKARGKTLNSFGVELVCLPCKGTGSERVLRCDKCKDGYFDCKKCDRPQAPPTLDDFCSASPCAACEGRGLAFRRVLWPCRACMGLGQKLTPKADPTKILP